MLSIQPIFILKHKNIQDTREITLQFAEILHPILIGFTPTRPTFLFKIASSYFKDRSYNNM